MKTLFDKSKINRISLENRFVRSSTWENMADDKGHLTERLFKVYEELAKGGVGLILSSCAFIMENHQPNTGMIGIYDDYFIDEYKRFCDMIHSYGSKIVLQLDNGSSQARYKIHEREIWGPSAVPEMQTQIVPKEMTKEDIKTVVRAFGNAAYRAKQSGFDGVQVHCAHGYCLSQFLSPYHNRRSDEYGGSIQNRARIVLEVYEEIRNRVGKDFAILVKINCEDFVPGGMPFEVCKYVCKELDKAGIDAIEISGGIWAARVQDLYTYRPNIDTPDKEAYFKKYCEELSKEINAPIILVGGLKSYEVIEEILNSTNIEYFSLSRPLMREPDLIKRWQGGDLKKSKCISCNKCFAKDGNVCIFKRSK